MNKHDLLKEQQLKTGLKLYEKEVRILTGIGDAKFRQALVLQFIDSLRRNRYYTSIALRDISNVRNEPSSELFDPERAAVLNHRNGNSDEAFWLVFLSIHFGKNLRTKWRFVRDIYGKLGDGTFWDWKQTSANPALFRQWLSANLTTLNGGDGVKRSFGNHRKYQSLHPYSATGTGAAIESYVNWVNQFGSHDLLLQDAATKTDGSPRAMFHYLYRSMDAVTSFGRTAKFDYLTMVGKLGLAPIEPGSAYMDKATGPLTGAKLLFTGNPKANLSCSELDARLVQLEGYLVVGMQAMEDALCNWQKSPEEFKSFRG
ncbi:MAG: hypothetical protein Q7T21_00615 [Gallionella sp.]|nr:hypothetical protein [Gallionella sp.]